MANENPENGTGSEIRKLVGSVEAEITGPGGTYQIRKTGGTVQYVANQGTVYHPVTYMIVQKFGRKGKVLTEDTPGRGSRAWLESSRRLIAQLAAAPETQVQPVSQVDPKPSPAPSESDVNPYEVISEEIRPTLEVIASSRALLSALDRAGIKDPDFDQCVRKGLERLRLTLADQLVERTSGGWLSGK